MKSYNKRNLLLVVLAISLGFGCSKKSEMQSRVDSLPYYSEASFTPHWFNKESDSLAAFHSIPSFSLTSQEGTTITEADLDNKIYVANFFFTTCPGICPRMTDNLKIVQEEFLDDDNVLLLSHSVTPDIDSVSVLKAYAQKRKIVSDRWLLLTGDRDQIYNLGRQSYFVEEDLGEEKSNDDFLHTENFILVDKNKHIRGIYNGLNKTSVQQLIADIKTLEKES
tara:strand:- start:5769 stop:6437 length:669 start_codon:yes stop_codon:yes gene_type:complete